MNDDRGIAPRTPTRAGTKMADRLATLQDSVTRLRRIVAPLSRDLLRARAYPSEWNIADVLSHLASSAVIMQDRIEAAIEGRAVSDDLAPSLGAEWDAKSPDAKAADGLVTDQAMVDAAASLTADQRNDLRFPFGPMTVTFDEAIGFRLNEHAVHTWDVEVALDPSATIPVDAAEAVVDNLGVIIRFAGKPAGVERDVRIHTTDPDRDLTLSLASDAVSLTPSPPSPAPDLELPAEALIRLVYGRLDPDHTPPVRGDADLDELRRAFPGL